MKTLDNYSLKEKKILVRVDLNVPVLGGIIQEKSRIEIIKPTIKKLQKQKNKIFLLSHFGRPKGKNNKYSLRFICEVLEKELNLTKIYFLDTLNNDEIKKTLNKMNSGDVCLLENIRFYPDEENNNIGFSKKLSKNFDVFINDAFSVSHRSHASIVGIPKFLPSLAGYSLLDEIKNIDDFVKNPKKPNLTIIGGSKISTKINLLYNLIKTSDAIVIGGAMANTFLHAKGINIGNSLCEKDLSTTALSIINKSKDYNCEIILPIDVVCANNLNDKINIKNCNVNNIEPNQMALDIGINTTELIVKYILKSKMILWNGPMGAFEYKPFAKSSVQIANTIKNNSKLQNISCLAGGGDTISVIKVAHAEKGFTYISKAGGAFLEWLEGKSSPGIVALKENLSN